MSFTSPWRQRWYVGLVQILRNLMRPFGRAEERFIEQRVTRQNRRVHNHLSGGRPGAERPAKVLLIMPRCVKKTGCRADVQTSLQECLTCLQCPLGDVALSCERHNVQALVAFRSHIAFDLARRHSPDLIVASACHDRMVKALRSVPDIPALLAPLSSMEKMCVNAAIDQEWLDATLARVAPRTDAPDRPAAAITPGPEATVHLRASGRS